MSGTTGGMEERVKLRLGFRGRFQQNRETMTYKYVEGDFYNESLPASAKYADFMFKLSEKLKTAVSVRYLSPGEDLDPEALVTIADDDDLQELFDEYFAHLHRPGTPSKTFRIRVFAFPATEEPLTPDEIMEGDSFFGVVDQPIRRLQLQRGSSLEYSSWCSTPSSIGSPSVRLASDAEAEYYTSRNGSHSPRREATHHSALSMYGGSAHQLHAPQLSPLDSDLERQALEHFRVSVNNPNFYGGWAGGGYHGRGSRLHQWQQQQQGRLEWQGQEGGQEGTEQQGLDAGEVEELSCYALSAHPIDGVDDDSCYQEACDPALGHTAAIRSCEGWREGEGCNADEEGYLLQDEQQQQQQDERGYQPYQNEPMAPITPPQPEVLGSGGAAQDRGLPADPWDMTQGHQAPTTATTTTQQLPASIAAYDTAAQAAMAISTSTAGAALNLPSHISAFGDEINEEQQAAAAALAGAVAPLQNAARTSRSTPRTQEFGGIAGNSPAADASPANGSQHLDFVFAEGVVNARNAPARTANGDVLNAATLAANGGSRRGQSPSDSGDSAASLPHIRAVHKVPRASVKVLRKIGEGAFGEVSVATAPLYGTVAIKWLKSERLSKYSQSFWREAGVLAELNHPNVLRFFGVVTDDGPDAPVIGIITEYVRGGSLAQFLRSARAPLPLWLRAEMALHAANGLAYLHELSVVHFDLKPDNLLLEGGSMPHTPSNGGADGVGHDGEGYDYVGSSHGGAGGSRSSLMRGISNSHRRGPSDSGSSGMFGPPSPASPDGCSTAPVVKVADFGLSKHKLNNYVSSCRDLRGTLPYMAPELVADPERVSEKADVWSLGVVMWEMLTRQVPFAELTPQQILLGLMCGNLQLNIPVWCEPEWRGLLEACMEPNPASRPSMRDLARQLEAIRDEQQAMAAQQVAQLHAAHMQAQQQQEQQHQSIVQVQYSLAATARVLPSTTCGTP